MHKRLISLVVLTLLLGGLLQAQTIPATTTALESYDMPGYFLVCTTSSGAVQLAEGGDQTPEGQWNIVTGLTGTGTVSFMPVALADHYMRHRSFVLYCDPAATDSLYLGDASFTPVEGMADPAGISFESQNYPGRFLQHNAALGLVLEAVTAGSEGAATFTFPEQNLELASNPNPDDEATDVPRDTTLSWTPGAYAASHDIYVGTSFDDVNAADAGSPLLVSAGQDVNTYDPPDLLDYAQTYYWRVDEVNGAPDNTVFQGNVWSFTTEPFYYMVENITVTASTPAGTGSSGPEAIVDGSGLIDGLHDTENDAMWSGKGAEGEPVWLQFDFDRVYKLYGMHIWNYNGLYEYILGFGFKDVTIEYATEPNEWVTLGDYELARGTNLVTYAGQQLDLDGVVARSIRINVNSTHSGGLQAGLSEIQFLYKPVMAREPQPADGATEVNRAASLRWRPGREAAGHQVYFGTDSNAVADGTALADTVGPSTYDPGELLLGTVYYWKVGEVNEAETPPVWDNPVWDFTTQEYVIIDGFESYTDDEGNRIYLTWLDGYGSSDNGSQVGHDSAPYAEEDIRHSGAQAMPLYYRNTEGKAYAEAKRVFSPAQDFSTNGADALSLYYRGEPTGFVQVSEDNLVMNGIGTDIWGTTDQFRFVYKQLTGNGSIIARVEYLDYTNEWAKAGVMIRETLDTDSVLVDGVVSADRRACMQWRTGQAVDMGNPDASSATVLERFEFPHWVKLTRTGDVFTVQHSTDGVTWIDIVPETTTDPTSIEVTMPSTVYVGLAVCSHNANAATGAEFTDIATTGNVTGQWQSVAIGADQPAGNQRDRFYLAVEDSSGAIATIPNPSAAAVGRGAWQQWLIPLSDITAAGVNVSSIKTLYLGVGDKTQPSKDVSGILYIDDVAFGRPIDAE